MKWNRSEIDRLSPILEQISVDLAPIDGKRILVVGSAGGEVAFRLAEMMEIGKVSGLELDAEALQLARRATHEMGLENMVEFNACEKNHLPLEDASFDILVSDSIVYPSSTPVGIGQGEMARVLAPGGKLVTTDVISIRPLSPDVSEALTAIGLDYFFEGTKQDFSAAMSNAGIVKVEVQDLTSILRPVWEARWEADLAASHDKGYEYLLDDPNTSLGHAIFYIYVRGEKPKSRV